MTGLERADKMCLNRIQECINIACKSKNKKEILSNLKEFLKICKKIKI